MRGRRRILPRPRAARVAVVVAVAVSVASIGPATAGSRAGSTTGGFVRVRGTGFAVDGKPFVMKGFDYYPRDYGWTSMTGWDWAAVDRELALAQAEGANTLRTGIDFLYSTGTTPGSPLLDQALAVTPGYLAAVDRLLALADEHGMKVILWVADALPPDLWLPEHVDLLQEHLESFVPRYANDPRIAAWDLHTDLDPAMLAPVGQGGWGVPWSSRELMVEHLRGEAALFRQLDSNHPLGVGFSWPSSSLLVQDFTDFLLPQFLGDDHPELATGEALGPAVDYGHFGTALENRTLTIASLQAKVRFLRSGLHRPMPIVLSEFGWPSAGPGYSPARQAAVYDAVCRVAFGGEPLAGALAWALTDFRWPPLGETYVPVDAAQGTEAERTFGVFDLDYRPKPAANVARRCFTATSASGAVSTAAATLVGTVGLGATIDLRRGGARVRTLEAGSYRITVRDRTSAHGFRLRGPRLDRVITGVAFVGTETVTVSLRKGVYRYFDDARPRDVAGAFRVV